LGFLENKNPIMHIPSITTRDTAKDTDESTIMIVTSNLVIICGVRENKNPIMHIPSIATRDTAKDTDESTIMIVTSNLVIICMGSYNVITLSFH
jgi:ATP-dependent protease Clp ATPase subunit